MYDRNNFNPYQYDFQKQYNNNLPCKAVTSIDEARAAIIDAFSPHIFVDLANKKIYTKQITNNGTALLQEYNLYEPEQEKPPEAIVESKNYDIDIEILKDKIKELETQVKKIEKGVK